MASTEVHRNKYLAFKRDAENPDVSIPTRIQAYFNALFHLIEMTVSRHGVHINRHQHVRRELEANVFVFGEETQIVWRGFQEIENRIRPGQIYGSTENGRSLARTQQIFRALERICTEAAGETSAETDRL